MKGLNERTIVSSVVKALIFSISSHFDRELFLRFRYFSLGSGGSDSKTVS